VPPPLSALALHLFRASSDSRGARGKDLPNDTEWIWLRLPPSEQ
jgi:hypothetical protein